MPPKECNPEIMKTKGKVRVAIIGTGYIGDYHARGLLATEGVEIVLAVDTNESSAGKFAERYGIKEVANDALSITGRDDIHAVVIGIPNAFHAPYALEFLKNGKDVFLEKPMAVNASEGREIKRASEASGKLVMVGHMWRFDEEVNYLKKAVDSDRLGKIVKTKGYGIHVDWGPAGWFTRKELAGGGALADMGVHAIDTVRYLLGDPKPRTVYARIGTHYGDYDVDDSGILVITWENDTTSIIESGWWHPHMDGPEAGTGLFGTKGYGSVFPTFLKVGKAKSREDFTSDGPAKTEHCDQSMYTRQMNHFIDCIRTRAQPKPGIPEGQVVLDIVDAAYLSSQQNEVVRLDS
jgi:predicted dehydrogenase